MHLSGRRPLWGGVPLGVRVEGGLRDAYRNVLMVPSIAVSDGSALSDTGNLVAVVPPSHDACVGLGAVAQPMVGLAIVCGRGGCRNVWQM